MPTVDITQLTGPWVIGVIWSSFLYGIFIVQLYIYVMLFPKDPLGIKLTMGLLFIVETIFTVVANIFAWQTDGSGWGNLEVLEYINGVEVSTGILVCVTQLIVQTFFTWRIWMLTRKLWVVVVIECISVFSAGCLIYLTAKLLEAPGTTRTFLMLVTTKLRTAVIIWLSSAAACDILIATAIVVQLWHAKNQAIDIRTAGVLNRLLIWTVETGTLTALMAVVDLAVFVSFPFDFYFYIFYFVIARVYANALVASLNSRAFVRKDRGGTWGTNSLSSSAVFSPQSCSQPTETDTPFTLSTLKKEDNTRSYSIQELPFDAV